MVAPARGIYFMGHRLHSRRGPCAFIVLVAGAEHDAGRRRPSSVEAHKGHTRDGVKIATASDGAGRRISAGRRQRCPRQSSAAGRPECRENHSVDKGDHRLGEPQRGVSHPPLLGRPEVHRRGSMCGHVADLEVRPPLRYGSRFPFGDSVSRGIARSAQRDRRSCEGGHCKCRRRNSSLFGGHLRRNTRVWSAARTRSAGTPTRRGGQCRCRTYIQGHAIASAKPRVPALPSIRRPRRRHRPHGRRCGASRLREPGFRCRVLAKALCDRLPRTCKCEHCGECRPARQNSDA
mmetsp:Transcript_31270/g.85925  ORF Transcript_31270/g.85925 Transcript_31270/m.85925 type:complete len:291 (+) Transcript_31270:90-962(+)